MNSLSFWKKVERIVKQYGVPGSVTWGLKKVKKKIINLTPEKKRLMEVSRQKELAIDKSYGVDTAGSVALEFLGVECESLEWAGSYEAVPWIDFNVFFETLDLSYKTMTFIDLGSGKGRSLLLASALPFHKIIGVEFSSKLNQTANENLENFPKEKMKCKTIETICLDAGEFEFPTTDTVLFLYNPFNGPVMEKVINNLRTSYKSNKRRIIVVYFNYVNAYMWENEDFLYLYKTTPSYKIFTS